ncbi:hypothetical protein HU200_003072 [Digitaria exilis]|uniref:AAA+ ATPase domain-containing protein n=1 Tax=Digitaria exilis TaxID=1010633 RepID=A0A835FYK2_9POAL|nr:hypothetical protein HU200_003072 [Digitaria exilis]
MGHWTVSSRVTETEFSSSPRFEPPPPPPPPLPGKRPRHAAAGRIQSTSFVCSIRRLIEDGDLAISGSSAEEVARALRNHRPDLRRKKLKPFTAAVRRVLSTIPSPSSDSDDDDDSASSRRRHQGAHSTVSSTTTSLSDESAAHPPPPPLDFNAMLRSQYAWQTSKQNPGTNHQQLEIEMARRLITSDCGGGDAKPEASAVSEGGGVGNGDKWPSFDDLGGMEQVIEQLLVEVVVPLCSPELPHDLGVRPLSGLLLHGPPGCGKTTLAHAIANETGVPFYKISAPDIVSGVSATNRPDAVDQALRRPGRFDREIYLGVPDVNSRKQILMMLARKLRLEGQFDFLKVARATPGFVGADLKALVNNAGYLAMNRIINKRRVQYCFENGAKEATKLVPPTLRREGFSSVPEVTWDDVGGLDSLRKEFRRYIRCIKSPEDCDVFGVRMQDGFMLFGPPGCGKTLIAQAMAHEAGANFIHIKGPELLNKYVGESESEIRKIFNRARTNAPCIVFFDEVDALATKRGKEGGWVVERLLNQLLVELDGAGQRKGVYVIGATNRIDVIDDAILRPGRLGKKHYVPIPGARERVSILKAHARHTPISSTVDLDVLALREACNNFTGADLASLVNEAAMLAVEERWRLLDNGTSVSPSRLIELSHFEQALSKVKPSVSKQQREHYETFRKEYLSTT